MFTCAVPTPRCFHAFRINSLALFLNRPPILCRIGELTFCLLGDQKEREDRELNHFAMFVREQLHLLTDYCIQHWILTVSFFISVVLSCGTLLFPLRHQPPQEDGLLKDPPSSSHLLLRPVHLLMFSLCPGHFLRRLTYVVKT